MYPSIDMVVNRLPLRDLFFRDEGGFGEKCVLPNLILDQNLKLFFLNVLFNFNFARVYVKVKIDVLASLKCKKCAKKMHIGNICIFDVVCIQILKLPSYRSAEKKAVQNIDFPD